MKELYLISVLGSLKIVCMIATPVLFILAAVAYTAYDDASSEQKGKYYKKLFKNFSIGFVFALLGIITIPTTQELYAIYSIGTTIDYLKENPEAKKLPNNIVNFLNRWLEDKQE